MPITTPPTPGSPIKIGGFDCWDESCYEIGSVKSGMQAYRTVLCNWGDRINLMSYLLGGPLIIGSISAPGSPYPDFPECTVAKVTTAMVPASGALYKGVNGMVACQFARLTIEFDPPTLLGQNPTPNPNLIECDFECDVFQIPGGSLLLTGGEKTTEPFALMIPTARLVIPRSGLTSFNGAAIFAALGTINSTAFYGAATNTVLFLGAPTKERITSSNQYLWDRQYQFKVRGSGSSVPNFNQGWSVVSKAFVNYDSSTLPFGTSDLNAIIGA